MNYYSIALFFAFILNAFFLVAIFTQRQKTQVNTAYLLLAGCFTLWPLEDFVYLMGPPYLVERFLYRADPIIWGSVGFLSLNFVYKLLKRNRDLPYYLSIVTLVIIALVSIFGEVIFVGTEMKPWGLTRIRGPAVLPLIVITIVIPIAYAVCILKLRITKGSLNTATKNIYNLIVWGAFLTLLIGVLWDVIIPILTDYVAPELGSLVTIIIASFIYQSVVKQNFLVRGVEEAAMGIFDNTTDGIILLSNKQSSFIANKAARNILGLKEGRQNHTESSILQKIMPSKDSGTSEVIKFVRDVDNAEVFVSVSRSPIIKNEDRVGEILLIRDVTEDKLALKARTQLEEQLRQSQKMEAIGTLAGGVAHDMNNVLSGVMGLASLLQTNLPSDDPNIEEVNEILSSAARGRSLTRDLLGFARKGKYVKKRIVIDRLFRKFIPNLKRTIAKNIDVEYSSGGKNLSIEGDPNQISHILLNLSLNSADAIKGAGKLSFSSEGITLPGEASKEFQRLRPGTYVRIMVVDNGKGMDHETLSRAFEPFFTTKQTGEGTGLGLSMVYGTVKNHNGDLYIKSEIGSGTTVSFLLPAMESDSADNVLISSVPPPTPVKKKGHVLLVDDEDLIRNSGGRMLKMLGYNVTFARNGLDAVQQYKKMEGEIIAVLLDMAMPVMDGSECFRKLREINPDLKIIISSGYAQGSETEILFENGAAGFLPKPYDINQLAEIFAKTAVGN